MTRQWGRVLGTALGAAVVTAAGQLGVAYGWGILRFAREFGGDGRWSAHLTWAAWVATVAVLAGAAAGAHAARVQWPDPAGLDAAQRIAVVLAAGVGATVTVPLTALPARAAALPGGDPALEAALASLLGAVAGLLLSLVTLAVRVVALSVAGTVLLSWAAALASAGTALGRGAGAEQIRLGVPDLPWFGGDTRGTVALLGVPVLVLLASMAVAGAARARGLPTWQVVVGGLAGPVVVAVPYLLAPPRTGELVQQPAYRGAMVALVAGAALALLVALVRHPVWAVVRRRFAERRDRRREAAATAGYAPPAGHAEFPDQFGTPGYPDHAGYAPHPGAIGGPDHGSASDPFAPGAPYPHGSYPTDPPAGYPPLPDPRATDPLDEDTGELPALTGQPTTDPATGPATTPPAGPAPEPSTGAPPDPLFRASAEPLAGGASDALFGATAEQPTGAATEPPAGPRIPRQPGPTERPPLFDPLDPVPLPDPPDLRRRLESGAAPTGVPTLPDPTLVDPDAPLTAPVTDQPPTAVDPLGGPPPGAPADGAVDPTGAPTEHAASPPDADGEPAPERAGRSRRGRRRHEEEHLDWVRSLSGADEQDDKPAGRRRLRRDWHQIEQLPIDPLEPPGGRG